MSHSLRLDPDLGLEEGKFPGSFTTINKRLSTNLFSAVYVYSGTTEQNDEGTFLQRVWWGDGKSGESEDYHGQGDVGQRDERRRQRMVVEDIPVSTYGSRRESDRRPSRGTYTPLRSVTSSSG